MRADEGVTLFRGIIEGDGAEERGRGEFNSSWVGERCGIGGGLGTRDIRFILRASVGEIVLAPRPVGWCGIIEDRFDDGVVFNVTLPFPGVWMAVFDEDRE